MNNPTALASSIARGMQLANTPLGVKASQPLTEAKGWKEIVGGISDPVRQATTALMLENYKNYRNSLDESTSSINVGNFDKFAFPILSCVSENLVAQDLVSVQPLEGPNGLVFYMNFTTGQQKGKTARGSKIWDARTGHVDRHLDSDDRIDNEFVATASGNDLPQSNLSYAPVMPGSVALTDSDGTDFTDDGNGNVVTAAGAIAATINYNTGALEDGGNNSFANGPIEAHYNYNSELNPEAQQVDFEIVSAPIYVKERKLRGRWSQEAAMALDALHKVNAESIVSTAIANNLQWEIDREIIEDVRRSASAGLVRWDATIPTGSHISYTEHKLSFVDALVTASNFIQRATNRVKANWMLMGVQPSSVVETLPMFEPAGGDKAEVEGVSILGNLGRVKCYTDPHYRVDEALVGYKGKDFVRTGYIFAPWVLLYTTPIVTLDDFLARKGFASLYGKKMVNSRMYATIECSGFTAQFGG
jgi:hypothetical protein